MTVSYSNVSPQNLELTPCRIKYNGVDLGGSHGNVKISISYKKAELKVDQLGETVVDRRVSGYEAKVETVLSEIKNKDNWKVAFPNITKVGSGPYAVYSVSKIGESDQNLAQSLLLHPLSLSDADYSGDYLFYKAVAESVSEVTFGPTEQQGLKVVWNIYPDFSVSPVRFFKHGDNSIGLIAASAGSPVYTGTGNGAMTSVAVYSGFTLTENITVLCVGVPAANQSNWVVSGSVSGVIGYFSITAGSFNFSSSKISFSLADGTTDFIIGDNFVIATTAANYA